MVWQLGLMMHDNGQPLRTCSDSAYAASSFMMPSATQAALNAMAPAVRAAAVAQNMANKDFRMMIEDTFKKHVALWP
jgi:hypothetical protein